MRKFVLLTDSACDLPVETAQKHHIDILCFKLALDGVGYTERVDFTPENPDWPDRTLTLDGNRYFNEDGRLFFRWKNDWNYTGGQFDEFREKTGKEERGVAAPPEKTLKQIKD